MGPPTQGSIHPPDRDAGGARGYRPVPVHHETDTAGRGPAEPADTPSLQALQPTGASPGGDAVMGAATRGPYLMPWTSPLGLPFALFRQQEDAHGYMLMLKDIIDHHGVPLALYSDRHIFQRSPKEPESLAEQLRGRAATPPSSVGPWRSWTSAHPGPLPPGERPHRALWGSFQDRSASDASTIEQANKVLWNASLQPAIRSRPSTARLRIDGVTVANDNTVRFNGATIQPS